MCAHQSFLMGNFVLQEYGLYLKTFNSHFIGAQFILGRNYSFKGSFDPEKPGR